MSAADSYPPEVRSAVMRKIQGKNTSPEVALRKALFAAGLRGWRCHNAKLPGKPDLTFGRGKLAVFVDGAFWHGHPKKYWPGRTSAYWDQKIAGNQQRDERVNAELKSLGWHVLRLWDFEVQKQLEASVQRVIDRLAELRPH